MFVENVSSFTMALLFWWAIFLSFQRVTTRYPHKNSWKKDIIITLLQSLLILVLFPIFSFLLKKWGL
jgi:hypothetical protein